MPSPWPQSPAAPAHRAAYADAVRKSFWLDTLPARDPHDPLDGQAEADLCIVGGGYTGLWAALYAKSLDPDRDVVLLEATRCGAGASGRNGGFLQSSLTHGIGNGLSRFPDELAQLERLGLENFRALGEDLERLAIDAEFEPAGDLIVALEPRELADLEEEADLVRRFGHDAELLDRERVRAEVNSPMYLGGLLTRTGSALVHAGKLADGLRAAAARGGVRIHEYTPVRALRKTAGGVSVIDRRRGPRRPPGPARHERLPSAAPLDRLVHRAGLRLRAGDRAARRAHARRGRVGPPAGRQRHRQPVPLLPADRRLANPVGRVRRGLPIRRTGRTAARRPRADVRQALPALLHDVPTARRPAVQPSVGRRDRHLQPLLGVLRTRAGRTGRVRARLHGPRRRREPVRRAGSGSISSTAARARRRR